MYRATAYTDTGAIVFQKYYRTIYSSVENLAEVVEGYILSEGLNLEAKISVHVKFLNSIDRH
jgi:hypothetical protein